VTYIERKAYGYNILTNILKDEAYSNLELKNRLNESDLEAKDRRFAAALVYGVLEKMVTA
jgi:hypothetical protein